MDSQISDALTPSHSRRQSDCGVVWLCRVLAISDFPDEPALYREFGRLARSPDGHSPVAVLLPGPVERRGAGGEQHLEATIAALIVARDHAYRKPQVWQPAGMRTPTGALVHVGRAYVDRQALDASGELVTRFLIVLDEWPSTGWWTCPGEPSSFARSLARTAIGGA